MILSNTLFCSACNSELGWKTSFNSYIMSSDYIGDFEEIRKGDLPLCRNCQKEYCKKTDCSKCSKFKASKNFNNCYYEWLKFSD